LFGVLMWFVMCNFCHLESLDCLKLIHLCTMFSLLWTSRILTLKIEKDFTKTIESRNFSKISAFCYCNAGRILCIFLVLIDTIFVKTKGNDGKVGLVRENSWNSGAHHQKNCQGWRVHLLRVQQGILCRPQVYPHSSGQNVSFSHQ